MRENDSFGKVIYMGDVQGPEKVKDTCVKTMHVGMMDRGFTVIGKRETPALCTITNSVSLKAFSGLIFYNNGENPGPKWTYNKTTFI
jgi:hypothetical protein